MSADARQQETATRGRLRIYLGYAPGAGTTCALLREGHQRARRGADVLLAYAQTQGRPHTQALLAGLEIIPPATFPHLGAVAEEIDLAAVLARRPEVALVDELAHRDLPGAGHARWQDVQALLAAGIDVISTVSIGHLASLADVVEKIIRIPPAQTVPDPIVRAADEIELVDVAPETLRQRMAAGHIYQPPEAEAALGGWFCVPNLSVLRELALRWLAGTFGGSRRSCPVATAPGGARTPEKVVVALGGGPEGQTLIRRAARIAARSGAYLLAVQATGPGRASAADRAALNAQRTLAKSLGGSWHQLAAADVPAALLAFAHAEDATQLVLGNTRHARLTALLPWPGTAQRVIRRAGGLDVHIVTCTSSTTGIPAAWWEPNQRRTVMTDQNASRPGRMRPAARSVRKRLPPGQGRHQRRLPWLASAAVAAAALIVAACTSSGSGSDSAASRPSHGAGPAASSTLKTATINGATLLTNAKGFTVYSFAPDTPTTSKCNGSCAHFWPPVQGPATSGPGVTGTLATITRSDGSIQATYNGHPLYTYLGDTAPGQAKGNGLNAAGGIWHEITATPQPAAAHHHRAGPAHPAVSTPAAPPATTPAQPANPIPQGNGGDHDSDNNGSPSDGDGNI